LGPELDQPVEVRKKGGCRETQTEGHWNGGLKKIRKSFGSPFFSLVGGTNAEREKRTRRDWRGNSLQKNVAIFLDMSTPGKESTEQTERKRKK